MFGSRTLPVYGRLTTFEGGPECLLSAGDRPVVSRRAASDRTVWRIGYDLFDEVRHLLTHGQPPELSDCPTLELHIDLLRALLRESEVEFLEVPPAPDGHEFLCCLTHDIDFYGIRRHKLDRTLAGFLVRASLGTLRDLARGWRTGTEAARNMGAILRLPLILLGAARDIWRPFDDYAAVEDGPRSTFFLVPFKGRPGLAPDGPADPARAVPYDVTEIREDIEAAAARGCELAVHGIDAWRDAQSGADESRRLSSITGQRRVGVRMHWLYFSEGSPAALDAAGFDYDSTWGYNDAVGYRAGTLQPFRFPGTQHLVELPLAIMDSALFSARRMALGPGEADEICGPIVEDARDFGGALVVNWHDRSLAPERLWGRAYRSLLNRIEDHDAAWFTTAQTAVDWFRWRRSIRFVQEGAGVRVSAPAGPHRPGLIRLHRRGRSAPEDLRLAGGSSLLIPVSLVHAQSVSNSVN